MTRNDADWIVRRRMRGLELWGPGRPSAEDVVGQLTAMQAQEHVYAIWSVGQRMTASATRSTVSRAFDDGRFLRTHVLRPTWHFVTPADLRWLIDPTGPRLDGRNARRYRELGLDPTTLARANDVIAEAVAAGPQTRRELAGALEGRGISPNGQRLGHLLMHAELGAIVCSGPMRGKQHTYAAFDARVSGRVGPRGDDALGEIARRYFTTRGPATLRDFGWWSGLNAADARRGLEITRAALESRVVDERTYWFAGHTTELRGPTIDLVQCYDEAIISYTQSRDVLRTPEVAFDVPRQIDGFAHVVLLDGRLLGHWRAVSTGGGVRTGVRIAPPLDSRQERALGRAIERYTGFAQA